MQRAERIIVGQVTGLFGVRGWVKVHSHTRPREAILGYRPWSLRFADGWRDLTVEEGRIQGNGIVARLAGFTERDQAAALIGIDIGLAPVQLPPPKANEYYWADLVGMTVVNLKDVELGEVAELLETGANDVMVIRGDRERLIPFIKSVIQSVDLVKRRVRVDWDAED